ncbi:hypothetical protein WA026_007320 [Henosepilachna vigintioctopunctata]|uniref:Uncharacterized protein n=1 Tax=Henosepilachna vigintioctopunctata TaxID=420089 RepID=A0AAW1UWX3_9CUCU
MSSEKPDTVPGLGFKDKDKALETIKNLEGRDPDYQKLAIKGLIGRAKRTLTLTKDKDKLQNINEAMKIFEEWLSTFEIENRSKENRAYLPLSAIKALLPLKKKFDIQSEQVEKFLKAYEKAGADYKNLRTVPSDEDKPTWDIVRNANLKILLDQFQANKSDLWDDELPSKEHLELILWAYSPEASKIKKNQSKYEEKLGTSDNEMSEEEDNNKNQSRDRKRKSDESSTSEEESPKKKNKSK